MTKEEKFRALAKEWKDETYWMSSTRNICSHPAYQAIIIMGVDMIPLILKDLEENGPQHWFNALRVLTGANPVPPEDAGYTVQMTEAWLSWGREHGYL